jgi:hypothetical protein
LYGETIGEKVKGIWMTERWMMEKRWSRMGFRGADGRVREISVERNWRSVDCM